MNECYKYDFITIFDSASKFFEFINSIKENSKWFTKKGKGKISK